MFAFKSMIVSTSNVYYLFLPEGIFVWATSINVRKHDVSKVQEQ